MKLKCIQQKSYKLTEGKEYEVEINKKVQDHIILTNDNGKVASYHKSLFETFEEQAEEKEQIYSIRFNHEYDTMELYDENGNLEKSCNFESDSCNNSCGIREAEGIDNLMYILREIPQDQLENLVEEAITDFVTKTHESAFITFSTTTKCVNFETLDKVLSKLCVSETGLRNNPNSGNDIKIWILEK